MPQRTVPGTNIEYDGNNGMFSLFQPLIKATDGLTLGQVCTITGLEASTVQNWVKRGFVARPVNKKYRERQLARILLISSLRDCMKIDNIGSLMKAINGNANDESDDIISEEKLYDYFCEILSEIDIKKPDTDDVKAIVEGVVKNYRMQDKNAYLRLRDALTVMTLTYIASRYKREADSLLEHLLEG
ncbi:MAG: DUF1836 domain-containing protein [Ruminococcaceae bacterium]|jgi:DNA-binding transcriptional MerR regulator|nr:DUF1836 domain-containing protein [Oscillospiraceae bacterium]